MRVLIAIAFAHAIVGCYEPTIPACKLRCADRAPSCPDGLVCNAENYCVADEADACELVVTVRDGLGDASPNVPVVFVDPSESVTQLSTNAEGVAVLLANDGTSATVLHRETLATTFLGVGPGVKLVSRPELATATDNFEVSWTPPIVPTVNGYDVRASCILTPIMLPDTAVSGTLQIPRRCRGGFDIMVFARTSLGVYAATATAAAGDLSVELDTWTMLRKLTKTVRGVPTNALNGRNAQLSAWLDATHLESQAIAQWDDLLGMEASFDLPVDAGALVQFGFAPPNISPFPPTYQLDVHKLGPGVSHLDRDFRAEPLLLPWVTQIDLLLDQRLVRWQAVAPDTGTDPAHAVVVVLAYKRGAVDYSWHIVAPASLVTATGTMRELQLPDLPGVYEFEPVEGDIRVTAGIVLLRINDADPAAVLGIAEGAILDHDLAGIAAERGWNLSLGGSIF